LLLIIIWAVITSGLILAYLEDSRDFTEAQYLFVTVLLSSIISLLLITGILMRYGSRAILILDSNKGILWKCALFTGKPRKAYSTRELLLLIEPMYDNNEGG